MQVPTHDEKEPAHEIQHQVGVLAPSSCYSPGVPDPQALIRAAEACLLAATSARGASDPNPPVAAAALDGAGNILSVHAHDQAGTPHAEPRVIEDLRSRGLLPQVHTLFVTLEPCNHHGRTPPCTEAILSARIPQVIYAVPDPNPEVRGGGGQAVGAVRLTSVLPEEHPIHSRIRESLDPWLHWIRTGRPWVTVKTALTETGSMIPPPGQTTFTSPNSLMLAHRLRRQARAILTGSGTILADRPEFTVRHVQDHPLPPPRWIAALDRRRRTPADWIRAAKARGFQVHLADDLEQALLFLGSEGVLEVLVEAGPTLNAHIISSGFWNQNVVITRGIHSGDPDTVHVHRNH